MASKISIEKLASNQRIANLRAAFTRAISVEVGVDPNICHEEVVAAALIVATRATEHLLTDEEDPLPPVGASEVSDDRP